MKCDEEKPSCLKCRSTGRTCDGYLTQESHQNNAFQRQQITNTGTMTIGRNPYVGIIGNDQERRGFKFFQFQTAQELASALDLSSWDHFMLQASHSNPAVLHAAIALGALVERFQINSVLTTDNAQANNRHDFACRQYYKAVTQLRMQLCNDKEHSVDFILMSCFLFVCFEFLQGNDAGALMHLRSGLEILCREQEALTQNGLTVLPPAGLPPPSSDPSLIMDNITYVFSILDMQATIWLGLESFPFPTMIPASLFDTTPPIPDCFSTLQEAKKSLDDQITSTYRFQRLAAAYLDSHSPDPAPHPALAERQAKLTELRKWAHATSAFLSQRAHALTPADLRSITIMNINHLTTTIILTSSFQPLPALPPLYHSLHPSFAAIVSQASTLLPPLSPPTTTNTTTSSPLRSAQPPPTPIFHFPALLIQPLYFTAVTSRHLPTCRRAIALLAAHPWREGAWDSAAMALIAQRKVGRWVREGGRYAGADGEGEGDGVGGGVGAALGVVMGGDGGCAEGMVCRAARFGELGVVGGGSV